MIVGILAEKNNTHLEQAVQAIPEAVDVIELRLDFLECVDNWAPAPVPPTCRGLSAASMDPADKPRGVGFLSQNVSSLVNCQHALAKTKKNYLKKIYTNINKPTILTLRHTSMGGHFKGTETQRLALLYTLAAELNPHYIDIESCVSNAFITKLHAAYPAIKIIRSYHHFSETPEDLEHILSSMQHPQISAYKIVTYAQTSLDNLHVLHFVKKHATHINLVAHCMGPLGLPSRIIGAVLGNYFTYARMPHSNTPVAHCPDVDTLTDIYNLKTCNKKTKIFALLGNPVEHSIGHLFHNKKFKALGLNALYLKIKLSIDELPAFFKSIKTLPFYGFSVTMPLKAAVLPYLDNPDSTTQAIGAANTIAIRDQQLCATNTDGMGALDAILHQHPLAGRHIFIIGAGGAAKAIAYASYLRKPASITILNRTLSTAEQLAEKVDGNAYDFDAFDTHKTRHVDIIINTIPNTDKNNTRILEVIAPYLSKQLVFMNIDYSNNASLLLTKIKAADCKLVEASAMFTHQALRQIDYWFRN
jgi:3-dehydroquinate dehydratase / shikimate dehydrogenase